MNEEEKKAIEFLKTQSNHWKDFVGKKEEKTIEDIIINLMEKQQKEIEKKDRQIDLMAETLEEAKLCYFKKEDGGELLGKYSCYNKEDWKQYFKNKAGEE